MMGKLVPPVQPGDWRRLRATLNKLNLLEIANYQSSISANDSEISAVSAAVVSNDSDISSILVDYLKTDGSNANSNIDIGSYNLTTTGTGTFGDLVVDTSTLYVDKTNNRVGIGDTNPDAVLDVIGNAFIGDDGTNYTEIKSDGEINLHGTARVYDGHELPAKDFKAPGSGAATLVNRGLGTAWRFDDGSEEATHTEMRIPAKWVDTEDVTVILIWDSPATSADCDWEIRYLFRADDEDMTETTPDGTLQAYKTSSSTANGLVHSAFTIPTADFDSGDKKLVVQVFRDGNDGSDTLGDSAFLHAVLVKGIANKIGGTT